MGNKVLLATILVFLFVANVSRATFLWNFRKLVSPAATHSPYVTASPIPSPLSGGSQQSPGKSGDSKGIGRANETCDGAHSVCKHLKSLVACVKGVDDVTNIVDLLIQNKGNSSLMVNIRTLSVNKPKEVEVPMHQAEKVNIWVKALTSQILLNAGDEICTLQMSAPVSDGNFFHWLPSYNRLMTLIYGAYFLLGVTIIASGVFACCKLRKRRRNEIPYQELEMGGVPDRAIDVETDEGWDQGWDDDWDDDNAVKSPGPQHPHGSISGNGLIARSSNKEGWED